jgi:hypothetical protein
VQLQGSEREKESDEGTADARWRDGNLQMAMGTEGGRFTKLTAPISPSLSRQRANPTRI